MNLEELDALDKQIGEELDELSADIKKNHKNVSNMRYVVENTKAILDDLDKQFCKVTGLTKTDIAFLFLATGLQMVRQYFLSNEKFRFDKATKGDKMMSNVLSPLPTDWKEILLQSVPYDAQVKSTHVGNIGIGGSTHRYRTLGHDPLLGWIFGTANIMTRSLTKHNLDTYQVKNSVIIRKYPNGVVGMFERAIHYSEEEPRLLVVSVVRQAIHFGSDYFTQQGLPVPLISTVNNKLAQEMISKWHIDMWSITRGAALSAFINQLIAIIHQLFYKGENDTERQLYEVRTRKILSYSNAIASATNLAYVAGTKDMRKLDVGGIGVTIYRLITDYKFIHKVKEDFIFGNYWKIFEGTENELNRS